MVDVEIEYEGRIAVRASVEEAFALVSDIHRSGMHFPAVDTLTPVDDAGRWRWKLKEKGHGPIKLRATYDVVYVSDAERLLVRWAPPEQGAGDMDSSGSWSIEPSGSGTAMRFEARTLLHIPGPSLMAGLIAAFAREELTRLKKRYVEAIAATLGEISP